MEKKDVTHQALWALFKETLIISAFTVGGGYVIVPLMQKKFVEELGWLEKEEMMDIVAMGQSAPGIFAVNTSIMVGFRIAGLIGSIVAVLAMILPPLVSVTLLSLFYQTIRDNPIVRNGLKGAQAIVGAIMVNVVWSYMSRYIKKKDWLPIALILATVIISACFEINVILILLTCAAIGTVIQLVRLSKAE